MLRRSLTVSLATFLLATFVYYFFSDQNTGHLHLARFSQLSTGLMDGRVLVVGGINNNSPSFLARWANDVAWLPAWLKPSFEPKVVPISACELFDPKTLTWKRSADFPGVLFPSAVPNAVILPSGNVMVSFGLLPGVLGHSKPNPCEIFDPRAEKWIPCPSPYDKGDCWLIKIVDGQVFKLQNGQCWVYDCSREQWNRRSEYDLDFQNVSPPLFFTLPNGETFESTTGKVFDRQNRAWSTVSTELPLCVIQLNDGGLLGLKYDGNESYTFNVQSKRWIPFAKMNERRSFGCCLILLNSGKALVIGGGTKNCEVFDPATKAWSLTGSTHLNRLYATPTILHDGRVLISGGISVALAQVLDSCEIYDPTKGTWTELY